MSILTQETKIAGPFPGLRPFEKHEAKIFFGRGIQVDDMIRRLEDHRFLAVVGSSGCGKSSLVRAGLLPALEEGELFSAGDDWLMVIAKPGATPFRNLAESWNTARNSVLQDEAATTVGKQNVSLAEAVLQSGPLGFLELINDAQIPPERNILLLIDQFEEIFRFRYEEKIREGQAPEDASDDANAFVSLLLATVQQSERPVYVVLTMRSDFLGDCNAFHGLPEAINDSQFLTPRMNQDQIRQAILGPLHVFGGSAEPALVNRIIGDIGNDPDQLPLMQHVLLRMWNQEKTQATWTDDRARSNKVMGTSTVSEYKQLGGVQDALSNHATEIFEELKAQGDERIVEMLFRSLRQRGEKGQEVRRPETIANIAATIEDDVDDSLINAVIKVVDAFRRPECSFLMPPFGVELTPDTLIDISHESLIRRWKQMRSWAHNEDESAEILEYVVRCAKAYEKETGELLQRRDLDRVNDWRTRFKPTIGWARRYVSDDEFKIAASYLTESRAQDQARRASEKEQEEKERQRAIQDLETAKKLADAEKARAELQAKRTLYFRRAMFGFAFLLVIATCISVFAFTQWTKAEQATADAKQEKDKADQAATAAVKAEKSAVVARKTAEDEKKKAKDAAIAATKAEKNALVALKTAEDEKKKADDAAIAASKAEKDALVALKTAEDEKKKASVARDVAFAAHTLSLRKVNAEAVPIILAEQRKLAESDDGLVIKLNEELKRTNQLPPADQSTKEVARIRLGLLVLSNDTKQIPDLLDYELDPNVGPDEFLLVRDHMATYMATYLTIYSDNLELTKPWETLEKSLTSVEQIGEDIQREEIDYENERKKLGANISDENQKELDRLKNKLKEKKSELGIAQQRVIRRAALLSKFDSNPKKWEEIASRLMPVLTSQSLDDVEKWGPMLHPVHQSLVPALKAIVESNDTGRRRLNAETLLVKFGLSAFVNSVSSSAKPVTGLVWIKPGKFIMGSPKDEEGRGVDETQHEVTISEGFYVGKTEITQQQYDLVMGENPSVFKNPNGPVDNVSWQDAMDYCRILNKMGVLPPGLAKLPDGYHYTLPTEAQWEFVCRGGATKSPDESTLKKIAVYEEDRTQVVGRLEENGYGVYDMLGNVEEWCLDFYEPYPKKAVSDPTGPATGKEHVFRGGSYFNSRANVRPAKRDKSAYWGQTRGFRVVGVKTKKK